MKLNSKLGKVFSYCELKGFLTRQNKGKELSLGYLGAQVKHNVTSEWRLSILKNENCNILRGYCPLNDIFNFYPTISKILQNQEPFGYFHETSVNNVLNESLFENEFYNGHQWVKSQLTALQLLFFCSEKNSSRWFDHWTRERLSWWRKYCQTPAKLQFDEVNSSSDSQQIKIALDIEGVAVPVEAISNFSPKGTRQISGGNNNCQFNCILSETLSENVALTLLQDAFSEKDGKTIMRLHHQIAPYKMAIAVESCHDDIELNKKLNGLATFISKDLNAVNVFNFPNANILTQKQSLGNQFQTFDEIGIPYVIVLNRDVLKSGIAGIRNRDTMLREQAHVSEIKSLTLRYLQLYNQ